MRRSLLYQVFPLYLFAILLAVGSLSFAATRVFRTAFYAEKRLDLTFTTELAIRLVEHDGAFDPDSAKQILSLIAQDRIRRTTLVAADGVVLYDSHADASTMENHASRPEIITARDTVGTVTRTRRSATTGDNTLYAVAAVRNPDDDIVAFVRVGGSVEQLDHRSRDALTALATSAFMILVATTLMSLVIVRRILRPLGIIERAARRFALGELDHRIAVQAPEEITAVAETLNGMAAELSGTISAIREQRNELEAVLSAMVEGVIVVDDTLRIRSINEAAARLFQREPRGHEHRTLIEYLRNSELDAIAAEVLERNCTIERSIILYQRGPINLQVHGSVLRSREADRPGVLLVLNDITRLKRLEDMRRDFVANVSHELRTPITSVMGFLETLRDGAWKDPERATHFLDIVSTHANRLNLIIEDLLSLSRLESHEGEIARAACHVEDVLTRVTEACGQLAVQRKVTVQRTIEGEGAVLVNENLLEQALINLVSNAIKFSPHGGRVDVRCRQEPGRLRISVEDQGSGIPYRDLDRIFERFYRVDRARNRDLGGTGLGLAIVKHIAIAHGGEVTVESAEGRGSCFVLEIPAPATRAD
ncbi:MAG: HAMP domain-containing protein [Spirochaetaceae bacterium]|nr:MAG: HAMP domain-containing protein [Spirochaetaceae bacterium]